MGRSESDEAAVPSETTARALVLGTALSVLMLAANIYLGLYAGMTVSASIPAAVISMALLRGVLRRGSVLENNIVQTMASAGESLAAGAIFTVPALLLVGAWQEFKFWPTTLIAMSGGILGVLFMVPLRRLMITRRPDLTFPEGVACAEVLMAGEKGGNGVQMIGIGLGLGAALKFLAAGVHLVRGTVEGAIAVGGSVFYAGADMSGALAAVGYIVDLPVASLIFSGGLLAWGAAIPLLGAYNANSPPLEAAWAIWSGSIRYLGVGAMLVGGLHALWSVRRGILEGVVGLQTASSDAQMCHGRRTDCDLPLQVVLGGLALAAAVTIALYIALTGSIFIAILAGVVMIAASFLFVAVATYIAGLVGSSNSPISGMTICALLIAAGVMLVLGTRGESAILATLGVAGVVCCATATAGDIAQDLKTGALVGATPARQQWTEIIAVVVPAFFIAPILSLLHQAYGIGTKSLLAPQAALFASLTRGFFGAGGVPWGMIAIGAGIGVSLIPLNALLRRRGYAFQAHVMPVAVGMYLPFSLSTPILVGGFLRRWCRRNRTGSMEGDSGVLFGSGLIAGEALTGIALAIPICLGWPLWNLHGGNTVSLAVFGIVMLAYLLVARRNGAQ